jgi:ATP-dependent Clp protease protease subunit
MKNASNNSYRHQDNRIITLGDIDEENANDIIQFIHEINYLDAGKAEKKREPIILIINSYGGDIYRGFGVVDAIKDSITPVHTVCYGAALSMGFIIMASGHKRSASKHSTFMYHEILWSLNDEKLSSHMREVEEGKRIMAIYDSIILKHTNLTKEQLDIVKKEHKDWYMSADEALAYGIIDEVC